MPGRASHNDSGGGGPPNFENLVDLHYAPLYRFAMSLTRSETDAADLVQETFLTWARKGYQLQDFSKAKAWLFTTLHREFLESTRHNSRFPHLDIAAAEEELPEVEIELANQLDAKSLLKHLGKVDPQYQAAVALFYLEDYSYAQIGEILQVPLGTVKSRIARGLAQLKKLIQAKACEREEVKGR